MNHITIGIADEHRLFREGLIRTFHKEAPSIKVALEACTGRELINKMDFVVPEILLIEVNMPELDGFQAAAFVRKKYPGVKIIILSGRKDDHAILRMVDLGVNAYIPKDTSGQELVKAVQEVSRNKFYFTDIMSSAMLQRLSQNHKPEVIHFSTREKEVANLICKAHTTQEIAEQLNLSARTIETHRRKLIQKTASRNTAGLVVYLVKQGFV